MLSIDPALWEQIERDVRLLLIAAFDDGFAAGAGAPSEPAGDPDIAQLLDDTRRAWADGLAAMEAWRRAYVLPPPPAPAWLAELQELRTED